MRFDVCYVQYEKKVEVGDWEVKGSAVA